MPRIEIIPQDFDESAGEGTPTFDVCKKCARDFKEGEPLEPELAEVLGEGEGAVVGSTDVEKPGYTEFDYVCECCDYKLTARDE